MKMHIIIIAAVGILGLCRNSFGLAFEHIGPVTTRPVVAQPDWPQGIVGIPRHLSRVYSLEVNGNENIYFKCQFDEINELIAIFAQARMRDHVVHIKPGLGKVSTFAKDEIAYNVRLQIVAGIALFFAREESREDLPLEPRLTILTGDDDGTLVKYLKWPKNVIVESEIPGIAINSHIKQPKREVYYGLCAYADGSPPVEFVKGVNSRITLWEADKPNGIGVGSINNKGFFSVLLSTDELRELRQGKTWLTITIGNFLVTARKTDLRFPATMLTQDKTRARALKVQGPQYYYGRILFQDGAPPILDPAPWPGAEISVSFPYAGPPELDAQGYFKLSLSPEQFEQLKTRKPHKNIYIPDLIEQGSATARFVYPANLLAPDKAKAGVVKIPRPQLPRKELSAAASKIGQPIPGFDTVQFEASPMDQIRGKPLLVCFWDMDQRPSRQCVRRLQAQKRAWQDKDTVVLLVHASPKTETEIADWLHQNAPSLNAGVVQGDPYDTLFPWGARRLPWLVVTDEGHIITKAGFSLNND